MPLSTLDPVPALVIVDLQVGLAASGVPGMDDVVARTARLAAAFRERGFPVVVVTATGTPPGRTDELRSAPARTDRPADFADPVPELDARDDDLRVVKQAWGAFTGTGLDAALRERDVTQVLLTGVATSIGVESTARSAHELGYHVVLVTDAMTDRDAGEHDHSVARIFPRLGEATTTADLLAVLGSGAVPARS